MNLFGNGVFAGVIKMRSYWITVGLDPVIGGCEREVGNVDRHSERRKPKDGRDCDVSTGRGPRTVGNTRTWKRQGRVSTWSFWREHGP